MNQPGKLDTISPVPREAAPLLAASSPAETPAVGDLDGISISTGRRSLSSQQSVEISVDKVAKAGVAFFSIQNLLALLPGWTVSLVSHIVLVVLLTVIATNPLQDTRALRLDGLMVDATTDQVLEDTTFDAIEQTEFDLLNVDVAALNSEAAAETADVIHEDGFDVSIMEGVADGIGLEAMAQSGLTPIATADEGGVQGSPNGSSTQFFGTKAMGSRFIFIIDASDSMNEGFRWQQAVNELHKSISTLGEKQEVLVLLYNFQTFPMFDTAPEELKLLPASGEFKTELTQWLDDQVPFGGTRPAHALSFSLSLKPDAIFLLSDGMLADDSIQVLARENPARDPENGDFSKIPIHTVSLGPSEGGAELMKFIADNNDGEFSWSR